MYNRYTPRQDGGFQRSRLPEPSEPGQSRHGSPGPQGNPPVEISGAQQHPQQVQGDGYCPSSASGFLSGLLPRNMDTGDLLMLLILLLLLNDGSEAAPDPLLTIALFFLTE